MNRMLNIFPLDSCGLLWLESALRRSDSLWTENPSKFTKILVSLD
jgi:hypothetical protein